MTKKRRSDATRLDEVDRTMYATFRSSANLLSQLYSQTMNHQRLSFHAGERHALEKLYQWILRQQEEGSRVTTVDIAAYLQNELEYGAEEPPMSPRLPIQHQHVPNTYIPCTPPAAGPEVRSRQPDHQVKNSVFSNALSSPVRHSLQHYYLTPGVDQMPSGNAPQNSDISNVYHQNRDANSPSSESMDMHPDGPGHEFP